MEILLAIAGLAGLALLLQQKALPTQEDALKAAEKLETDPNDQNANLTVGKFRAFVVGDYKGAMPFLSRSGDATLKTLAEHEMDPQHTMTAAQKVGMGDEWVVAARKFPALSRSFFDRASQWYIAAWPNLDGLWKEKAREQGTKMAVARPLGTSRKGLPRKWQVSNVIAPIPPTLDGSVAHMGSHSIKIPAADPKISTSDNGIQSDPIPFAGQNIEYSAYVRTNKTERQDDQLYISFFDETGGLVQISAEKIPSDVPFWNHVSGKLKAPANAASVRLGAVVRSKKGIAWVDDMSIKVDGNEILPNPSFEER